MAADDPTWTSGVLTAQRQLSANCGHSLEPFPMAACGWESGRSDDALQTAGFDQSGHSRLPDFGQFWGSYFLGGPIRPLLAFEEPR